MTYFCKISPLEYRSKTPNWLLPLVVLLHLTAGVFLVYFSEYNLHTVATNSNPVAIKVAFVTLQKPILPVIVTQIPTPIQKKFINTHKNTTSPSHPSTIAHSRRILFVATPFKTATSEAISTKDTNTDTNTDTNKDKKSTTEPEEKPSSPENEEKVDLPVSSSLSAKEKTEATTQTIRTAPTFDAAYFHNPAPRYPPLARKMGHTGKVVLRVFVQASGEAKGVTIHKSSGFESLDTAAVAAVEQWQFIPAKQGKMPIGASVLVPVQFELN